MHNAFAGGHELQIPCLDGALVACEILMVDGTLEKVGDCFLTAVRVVREARAGGDGEMVEHEEGGEVAELGSADAASDSGACSLALLNGQKGFVNCT